MDYKRVFAGGWRWFPHRLLPAPYQMRYLAYRSHLKPTVVQYAPDLAQNPVRWIILPDQERDLYPLLPLVARLCDTPEARYLANARHHPVFRHLGVESQGLFYEGDLCIGSPSLESVEQELHRHPWTLAIVASPQPTPVELYLAMASHAPMRLGIEAPPPMGFPFINIAFRCPAPANVYSWRHQLANHLAVTEAELQDAARNRLSKHVDSDSSDSSGSLRETLLVNLEGGPNGRSWSEGELRTLAASAEGKFRLIALHHADYPDTQQQSLLEQLGIRTMPVLSAGVLFDRASNSCGIVSLDAPLAHLLANLAEVPILVAINPGEPWKGPALSRLVERGTGIQAEDLQMAFG